RSPDRRAAPAPGDDRRPLSRPPHARGPRPVQAARGVDQQRLSGWRARGSEAPSRPPRPPPPAAPPGPARRRRALRRSPAWRRYEARRRNPPAGDRKSTRLNSSHVKISYAVFCLKKKTNQDIRVSVLLMFCNCLYLLVSFLSLASCELEMVFLLFAYCFFL